VTTSASTPEAGAAIDPLLLAVLANRFDSVCREMTNTLLRAGRSTVLSVARDFSCSIVTADDRLLAAPEGLPVHVFGSHLVTGSMREMHGDDVVDGDAFLHNDPYMGNTHAADHTILVPVIVDGEHLFTAVAKAHQADCGNSLPTTYMSDARDVYEEGALIFPCVRVQRERQDVSDVIRMCQRRIRHPEQWYGDYLASLGAARIGERRIKELVAKYGVDTVKAFVEEWFDYSERLTADALAKLPATTIVATGAHDPTPRLPEGVPVTAELRLDPAQGRAEIDLRDNVDCVPAGLNLSMACSINNAMTGLLNALGTEIPCNAGTFRRVTVQLREGAVIGIPKHPTSTSAATTNVADRVVNAIQSGIADATDGFGLAEGGMSMGPGIAVVSGEDPEHGVYVNELVLQSNGGPASPEADGWLNFGTPVIAGMMYRDSVEVDEQKYPLLVKSLRVLPDTGGAGRHRGGPAQEVVYGPRSAPMTVIYSVDGNVHPPRGVRGGHDGSRAAAERIDADGTRRALPSVAVEVIEPGEWIVGTTCGGGGYGAPAERDPERVAQDVREGWVSVDVARDVYRAVVSADGGLDEAATQWLRAGGAPS
jgi:N-methylhydantoinase B